MFEFVGTRPETSDHSVAVPREPNSQSRTRLLDGVHESEGKSERLPPMRFVDEDVFEEMKLSRTGGIAGEETEERISDGQCQRGKSCLATSLANVTDEHVVSGAEFFEGNERSITQTQAERMSSFVKIVDFEPRGELFADAHAVVVDQYRDDLVGDRGSLR
jgi:hypothetical protein